MLLPVLPHVRSTDERWGCCPKRAQFHSPRICQGLARKNLVYCGEMFVCVHQQFAVSPLPLGCESHHQHLRPVLTEQSIANWLPALINDAKVRGAACRRALLHPIVVVGHTRFSMKNLIVKQRGRHQSVMFSVMCSLIGQL